MNSSLTAWQVMSYDSHTNNVMAVGFQCDGNWMYSGSEDGTVKIWDLRLIKISQNIWWIYYSLITILCSY